MLPCFSYILKKREVHIKCWVPRSTEDAKNYETRELLLSGRVKKHT